MLRGPRQQTLRARARGRRAIGRKIIRSHLVEGQMVPGEEIGLRIDQTLVQGCATGTLTVYGLPPRSPKSPRPPATLVAKLSVSRPQPSECTLTYVGELRYVPGE